MSGRGRSGQGGRPASAAPPAVGAVLVALLREPISRRAGRELLWCLIGVATGVVGYALVVGALYPGTAVSVFRGVPLLLVMLGLFVMTGAARAVAGWYRRLAGRWLGVEAAAPPASGRWRSLAYDVARIPLGVLELYPLLYWAGVVNLTYPFWWGLFRNHAPGVHLRPVGAITPFGVVRVSTVAGAFVAMFAGAGMVLAAPWVTRAVIAVDRRLIGALLTPGRMAQRVRHLEQSRAFAVDDAASTLRRIERDLHDGPQAQLVTLAMKLGQAKERLEDDAAVAVDVTGALALVDAAHRHAKEALVELRTIARTVHPPALDVGLDAALATLVSRSPVPTDLTIVSGISASPAIETIAYYSVAELLANVARHSRAVQAHVDVTTDDGWLRVEVVDDGLGGARVGNSTGTGLAGLAERVRGVDGRLDVASPRGGPTVVVINLPLQL